MTSSAGRIPAGHYRFTDVARMEWIKLRSLRSTWWTLAVTVTGAVAIAVAVGFNTKNAVGDLTNNALAGLVPGLLFAGVLGVLVMTGEYTSGMIRATLAAIPRRPRVLAAKTAVFGAVTLALGEAAAFISFFAGGAALRHGIHAPALSQPGVLRAVVLSGAGFCLTGLLGVGLGAIIRHTAGRPRRHGVGGGEARGQHLRQAGPAAVRGRQPPRARGPALRGALIAKARGAPAPSLFSRADRNALTRPTPAGPRRRSAGGPASCRPARCSRGKAAPSGSAGRSAASAR